TVTLLPPHVPHDGRSATQDGFRKRVVYLDTTVLPADLLGAAASHPELPDVLLRDRVARLHASLAAPGDAFEAENRLALVVERLRAHLRPERIPPAPIGLADRFRELLDARTVEGITLREASTVLG